MSNQPASGRHFLQIPGPSNVPERILRAMAAPTIDHRGPTFAQLSLSVLRDVRQIFRTTGPVVIYPSSGTGAWEAALSNLLAAGDRVLMFETGHFATLWQGLAERLGLVVEMVPGDWRHGVDAQAVEDRLRGDGDSEIRAVCMVHNETSTGVTSPVAEVRRAIDAAGHPALFLVDTISSLGCSEYCHDDWGVDVTICGSQKGFMLPPGLGFNAVSEKALAQAAEVQAPVSYWRWAEMIELNGQGFFPYTPATNLLYGLREALDMLLAEGLDEVVARHARLAAATRRAVAAWELEIQCLDEACHSNALTAVRLPDGHDADRFRQIVLERFNMSLGNGLAKVAGKLFRIGHLGDFNELMLAGTLAGVEMGLHLAGVPHHQGGVEAALNYLKEN